MTDPKVHMPASVLNWMILGKLPRKTACGLRAKSRTKFSSLEKLITCKKCLKAF